MAAITVTREEVQLKVVTGSVSIFQAGEAIEQGMPCYQSDTDGKYYKAYNNATAEEAAATVYAVTPAAAADDYFAGNVTGDRVDSGATLTKGEVYVVGTTAGSIEPLADLTSGEYFRLVGYAVDTSHLQLLFSGSFTI
jgi:hypothetical protein